MGVISPLGPGLKDAHEGIKRGATGIGPAAVPGRLAGLVGEMPEAGEIPRKVLSQMKFLNRGSMLGFHASREAVASSGIVLDDVPPERRALYVASGDLSNIDYHFMYSAMKDATNGNWAEVDCARLNASTLRNVPPFFLLESIANNLFSFLSAFLEFMGPSTSVASLSPTGSLALELAARSVRGGRADVALAVGCGSWVTDIVLHELDGIGVLSGGRHGAASFRPLDAGRDGFIPGEGGAALLVETEERARARGAKVLGRLTGFGNSIEHTSGLGFGIPEAVTERSMEEALKEAGARAEELSLVVSHGSGTRRGDRSELESLKRALRGAEVPICALKPYTGHMGAASDLAEVALGLCALGEGTAPGTLNFRHAESAYGSLAISAAPRRAKGRKLLSISYGVGGQASTVVVDAP